MRIAEDENKRVLGENGKLYLREKLQTTRIFGSEFTGGYLQATFKGKQQGIHRHVYENFTGLIPKGFDVHHLNYCRTDNRLENLEPRTHCDNCAERQIQKNNTSSVIGVCFHTKSGKWRANNQSTHLNGGKRKHIGYFNTKEDAGLARDLYVINNHLEYYPLNFPSCRLKPPSSQ